ncbi:general secretion pathway protein GspK [Desulfobotulus sp. H1]|uniref:General secretion pathway protein GspK n=1 Tax=Desulfobotulus pelophilus TaxID=2823377 RepID=A0ABT3N713_9BACT|nr:general secretion pathway protein GspK [Desulfobotulus pelophilus]MCW7752956.1 general secretion pathway protein GspK [Desulfobotulus pelophilus]
MQKDSGMALIAVLSMMLVLVALVTTLHRQMGSLAVTAQKTGDRMQARAAAMGGVEVARALLARDRELTETDTLQDIWNDPEILYAAVSSAGLDPLPEVLIEDELGKIQVNALVHRPNEVNADQAQLWDRFLKVLILHDETLMGTTRPSAIINPLIDWLDSEDDDRVTGLDGAEADYYATLDPPYAPRNGPFTDLSELQRVRGITPELWDRVGGAEGLGRVMTVWNGETRSGRRIQVDGRININTAPQEVIAALITEMSSLHMAAEIQGFRDEKSEGIYINELEGNWYRRCTGCEDVPLAENLITRRSDIFRIISRAAQNGSAVEITVIVRREKDNETGRFFCRILRWHEE